MSVFGMLKRMVEPFIILSPTYKNPTKPYIQNSNRWILKTTHAGADLDTAFEMSRGRLDGELAWIIGDILANRDEWWVPGKLVEARHRLQPYWRHNPHVARDVVLLDISLDAFFRLRVERMDKSAMSGDDLINLIGLTLNNAAVASESEALHAACGFWNKASSSQDRWANREWAMMALAATEHAALCLEDFADSIVRLVQPHAVHLGTAAGIESSWVLNFGEEVIRAQPAFVLSPLLRALGPKLREAAGVGPWQIVGRGDGIARGRIAWMKDMEGIQGNPPTEPTVAVVDTLTGNEDIPETVVAVLSASATDVLSHIAIRARAQKCLLATCFDDHVIKALQEMDGEERVVKLDVNGGVNVVSSIAAEVLDSSRNEVKMRTSSKKNSGSATGEEGGKTRSSTMLPAWALVEAEFAEGAVGGKALNLAGLRDALPAHIKRPASIALPYGTFERVMNHRSNSNAAAAIQAAEEELASSNVGSGAGVPPALRTLRNIVRTELIAPVDLVKDVASAAVSAGLINSSAEWYNEDSNTRGTPSWDVAWSAICTVWASKWNDRAWLSRQSMGLPEDHLFMSVLIQQIIPAKYSFVLHTVDPVTGDTERMMGEMAVGMGEALVGNYPGRALSFIAPKGDGGDGAVEVCAFPSKRDALYCETSFDSSLCSATSTLIARSDSNGEDLEDFAGAGLYSSVPMVPFEKKAVRYDEEAIVWSEQERADVLKKLVDVGCMLEKVCGGRPQDVEGVVDAHGNVYVVQTRPQVV